MPPGLSRVSDAPSLARSRQRSAVYRPGGVGRGGETPVRLTLASIADPPWAETVRGGIPGSSAGASRLPPSAATGIGSLSDGLDQDDRIIGLDPDDVAVDRCLPNAPGGAGRSPLDHAERGLKGTVVMDGNWHDHPSMPPIPRLRHAELRRAKHPRTKRFPATTHVVGGPPVCCGTAASPGDASRAQHDGHGIGGRGRSCPQGGRCGGRWCVCAP